MNPSTLISQHLVNGTKDCKTFIHSMEKLLSPRNIWANEDLWNMTRNLLMNHYDVYVFKLQLIYDVAIDDNLSLKFREIYHILTILLELKLFC